MSPLIKKLRKQDFKVEVPTPTPPPPKIYRGYCIPAPRVSEAVNAYLRIKVKARGDAKRIAEKFSVPLSSLLTQAKRRAVRGEIAYPKIYKR